ncbi:MAG: metalloenzyme, partial [Planctomycetes bacterium]|nr:metalloenzyme [Planctomycetota bacterium]
QIRRLDAFLESFLAQVDLNRTLVLLTSDHGNIEDLSVRGHTRNPALTVLWGKNAPAVAERMDSILDVTGLLLRILN